MTVLELINALRDTVAYRVPDRQLVDIEVTGDPHAFRIDRVEMRDRTTVITITPFAGPRDDDAVAPEVASDRD